MSPADAAAAMRIAFSALFVAQSAVALTVGGVVALVAQPESGAPSVIGVVLVLLGAVQGPAGVAAALAPSAEPEALRRATLQRTLLAAAVLSTPAWYLAFLLAAGVGGWPAVGLGAMLALYAVAGAIVAGRLGARAAHG